MGFGAQYNMTLLIKLKLQNVCYLCLLTEYLPKYSSQLGCRRSWDHDSWSEIVAMLILTGMHSCPLRYSLFHSPASVLGLLFSVIAFSYYRQLLDPTSPANTSRAPSNQARMGAFPSHYNPPYNASVPNLPYGYNAGPYTGQPYSGAPYQHQQYAPPAGPPPDHDDPFAPPYDGKPPGYIGRDGKGFENDGKDNKDPFADFDGPSAREERDVTSRPGPGGNETFRWESWFRLVCLYLDFFPFERTILPITTIASYLPFCLLSSANNM